MLACECCSILPGAAELATNIFFSGMLKQSESPPLRGSAYRRANPAYFVLLGCVKWHENKNLF